MGTAVKHPVPDRVKPSFVILTSGHSDVKAERQSARMSKITIDCLTRSGTGCFMYRCTHVASMGVKGLTYVKRLKT